MVCKCSSFSKRGISRFHISFRWWSGKKIHDTGSCSQTSPAWTWRCKSRIWRCKPFVEKLGIRWFFTDSTMVNHYGEYSSSFFQPPNKQNLRIFLSTTTLPLKIDGWKTIRFPLGKLSYQVRSVSFQGCNPMAKGVRFGSLIAMCFKVPNVKQKVDG